MIPIGDAKVAEAVEMLQKGSSCREIQNKLGISKSSVSNIKRKLQLEVPTSKGGRRQKLTDREARRLSNMVIRNEAKSAPDATRIINRDRPESVSSSTVRRALRKQKLIAIKKQKKQA